MSVPSRDLTEDLRVRVDEATRAELEQVAEREYLSLAALIRRYIRAGIEAERTKQAA